MSAPINLAFGDRKDLRSDAVDRLHKKSMRYRYKGVDAATLGRPKDGWRFEEDEDDEGEGFKRREVLNKRELHHQLKKNRSRNSCCSWCSRGMYSRLPRNPRYDDEITMARDTDDGRCCPCCMEELAQEAQLADITYSYDHPRGPTYGSDILSQALNQAVVRFEAKELDKLVKAEYDVIKAEEDPISSSDDEFELV